MTNRNVKRIQSFFNILLLGAFSIPLLAQQSSQGYYRTGCIKAKPGKGAEYRKFVTDVVTKIGQAEVDSGRLSAFSLMRAVVPTGSSQTCDYISIHAYPAAPPAPLTADQQAAMLTKAGLSMSPQEYYERLNSLSDLITTDVSQTLAFVGSFQKGDYMQVNYMKAHNMTDYLAYEQKVWKPLAEQFAKDGTQRGWYENVVILPAGSDRKFDVVTVYVFPSWDALFAFGKQLAPVFKKTHPGMDIAKVFDTFDKLRTNVSTQVFVVDELVTPNRSESVTHTR